MLERIKGLFGATEKREVENNAFNIWLKEDSDNSFCVKGYTSLSENPEVRTAIERIAELISSMTIHLMENGEYGDKRVYNELSKKIDIKPNKNMTRQNFIHWIVKVLLLEGNAIVYPEFKHGLIDNLIPINPYSVNFRCNKTDYAINVDSQDYKPDEVLHFLINPKIDEPYIGESYKVVLQDVIRNLKQANKTTNAFMGSKVMPNIIVKVDSLTAELSSKEGRDSVYRKYLESSNAGEPWIIPADLLEIEQVKPLTLKDIAITDTIKLDKHTVAGILGIPAFLLGEGEFNKDEYNNFIRTRVMAIAKGIEQELTKKLLISPTMYFKFNSRTLYSYEMTDLGSFGGDLFTKGILTGNEVRDLLGFSPSQGLDKHILLENYIPLDKVGEQTKLGGD